MKGKVFKTGLTFILAACFSINAFGITNDVELTLDKDKYVGLGDRINIKITAPGLNLSANAAEHLELHVYTGEDPKGFSVYIQETKTNSGVFSGRLQFSLNESDPKLRTVKVCSGTTIYIRYKEIIEEAIWLPDDGSIKLGKKSYGGYGVRPVLTLTDNDLNVNPLNKEEAFVTAYSDTDTEGITVKLVEKAPDSGIFIGDFGLVQTESDDAGKKLQVSYNDTITVIYNDSLCTSGKNEKRTCESVWKPDTGTVKLNKSSYIGLHSKAGVTITDQDLNLRPDYKDTARVRIASNADTRGFIVIAVETGVNTGVFSGSFRFSADNTDSDKDIIKINPTDSILATYIDERNANNVANTASTATASFQFSEAVIQTSAADDEGTGNMLDITITEPDANRPAVKDRIIAKAGSWDSTDDLTLYLEETGSNTGNFKYRLYFTGDNTGSDSLQLSQRDKVNIKYIDNTIPQGGTKEIIKTVKWTFQSTTLKTDKESYTGYNTPLKISLINRDLNKSKKLAEYVKVKVSTSSNSIELRLKETKADSGEFSGTLYFGKSTNRSKGILKVANKDTVVVSYDDKKGKADVTECSAVWSPQDAQITLDKKEYKRNDALVKITVKDWDAADNLDERDIVKVIARIQGSAKYINVTLTETRKNSGVFTGTLYINGSGSNKPSVKLGPADKLEVAYTDKDTTSGNTEDRKAYAAWAEN